MTLEEFKKGFMHRSICIYAPTDEEVDAIKDVMISAGWFSNRGNPYNAHEYPYLIYHWNCLTGWTGGGTLKDQYIAEISASECLTLFDGISEESDGVDISSLI